MGLISAVGIAATHSARNLGGVGVRRLIASLAITFAFALLAWFARGVNWSGALAGSAIAFIFTSTDLRIFWVLLLVFAVTLAATRAGRRRKQEMRMAEASAGRSASQVIANLGIAGVVVALAPTAWPLLALAALAEVAADTCSSEIGMAFPGATVLLTSWKRVAPGVDGAISLRGTAAAVTAATLVSSAAVLMKLVSGQHAMAVIYAGLIGTIVDSLLGALLERRGFLNNDVVNLLSSAASVAIMAAII